MLQKRFLGRRDSARAMAVETVYRSPNVAYVPPASDCVRRVFAIIEQRQHEALSAPALADAALRTVQQQEIARIYRAVQPSVPRWAALYRLEHDELASEALDVALIKVRDNFNPPVPRTDASVHERLCAFLFPYVKWTAHKMRCRATLNQVLDDVADQVSTFSEMDAQENYERLLRTAIHHGEDMQRWFAIEECGNIAEASRRLELGEDGDALRHWFADCQRRRRKDCPWAQPLAEEWSGSYGLRILQEAWAVVAGLELAQAAPVVGYDYGVILVRASGPALPSHLQLRLKGEKIQLLKAMQAKLRCTPLFELHFV